MIEHILNPINLKSLITFIHLIGLALGAGGAFTLDLFIASYFREKNITADHYQIIRFISKLVTVGLSLLWLSGLLFLTYYYIYTPEFLTNEKIWAKIFIVIILSINGAFIHKIVLPTIQQYNGKNLMDTLKPKELNKLIIIGIISFLSWNSSIVLGVLKTLNFTVSAPYIIAFYLLFLTLVILLAQLLKNTILTMLKKNG